MTLQKKPMHPIIISALYFLIGLMATLTFANLTSSFAQEAEAKTSAEKQIIQDGTVVVTGFAGTALPDGGLEPGVDPIEATFIDPDGAVLRAFDLSNLVVVLRLVV